MNVILIPCRNRPEMLYIVLERLKKCFEIENWKVLFHLDFDYDKEIEKVIATWKGQKEIVVNKKHHFKNSRLSHNVLEGYRKACELSSDLVCMIEEDIAVSTDFLLMHKQIQHSERVFCSIACDNHNRKVPKAGDSFFYTTSNDYISWGVCFKKKVLKKYVLPHANNTYYSRPVNYILKKISQNIYGTRWPEQAGLIRRIQKGTGLPIAFPYKPRAFHIGFYGKNRVNELPGWDSMTLQDKVLKVKEIAFDYNELKKAVKNPNYAKDSKPVPLDLKPCYMKFHKKVSN